MIKNSIKYSIVFLSLLSSAAFANNNAMIKKDLSSSKIHRGKEGKKFEEFNAKKIAVNIHKSATHKLPRAFKLKEISIVAEGEDLDDKLKKLYEPYLGKIFTDQDLFKLSKQIINIYHEAGYLLPRTHIIKHDIESGSLEIGIMLDSIKDVVIIGDGESSFLMKEYARKITNIKPAKTKEIQTYIGLISKLPGFTTEYIMRESDLLETNPNINPIELVLITSKMKASSHLRIDNFGIKETGRYQANLFSELYSPFNRGELFTSNLAISDKPDRMSSISGFYEQPINAKGTSLNFLASYGKSNPTKDLPVKAKDNISWMSGMSISHYIMIQTKSHLKANLGVNYQNTVGYNVPDAITSGKANNIKLYTSNISLDYMLEDNVGGKNLFEIIYNKAIGGKIKYYNDPVNRIDKNFNLLNVSYFRDQQLPQNFSYFAHLAFQTSDKYLPDAENFVVGNRDFGRAYINTVAANQKGVGFSFELRYSYKTGDMALTEIEPYAYYDIAKIYHNKKKSNTNISSLSSAGPGVRFKFKNDYMAGLEVAFPFKKKFIIDSQNHKSSTHFTFFVSKTFRL